VPPRPNPPAVAEVLLSLLQNEALRFIEFGATNAELESDSSNSVAEEQVKMSSLQAYPSATSVSPGGQIDFLVSYDHGASSSDFTIDFYRIGAAEVHLAQGNGSADAYATPGDYNYSGCQWPPGYSLQVPNDWASGVYRARLTGSSGDATDVLFAVKAAAPGTISKVLLALAVNTYQAYNEWGGSSLYSAPRSVTVTFDRPGDQVGFLNIAEAGFISWAENNHIALEYCTSLDLHANPEILNGYQLLLSVGHDEYWSKEMRDGVEAFILKLYRLMHVAMLPAAISPPGEPVAGRNV
jgi:hypothetical protein